jgi:hypothetical protein
MRKNITEKTLKKLFGLSGNSCYFPQCTQRLIDVYGDQIFAQMCHIEAAEPGGERYNPEQTDDERRDFANLLLLCPTHHVETNNVQRYTVEVLKKMKNDHEGMSRKEPFKPSDRAIKNAALRFNQAQNNVNLGSGSQINNQTKEQTIRDQIAQQNNYFSAAKEEIADWGIIGEILDFVANTTAVQHAEASQGFGLKSLEEKIRLNFKPEHADRVNQMIGNLWSQKQLIQRLISETASTDPQKVVSLKEKIQSDFFRINKEQKRIEDVQIIEEIANACLPKERLTNPQYHSNAKALVLFFFELCEIGKKTDSYDSPN